MLRVVTWLVQFLRAASACSVDNVPLPSEVVVPEPLTAGMAALSEEGACAEDDEGLCSTLSLRQLRGEALRLDPVARAPEEAEEEKQMQPDDNATAHMNCKVARHLCGDYVVYATKTACAADFRCRVRETTTFEVGWKCVPRCGHLWPRMREEEAGGGEEEEDAAAGEEELRNSSLGRSSAWGRPGACNGRPHCKYLAHASCQCNHACPKFGDCCSDWLDVCDHDERKPLSISSSSAEAAHGDQISGEQVGGQVMTLYHTTSVAAAQAIVHSSFRPGHTGWCGGAIYFIDTPILPKSKHAPGITQDGAILEARVRMGRMGTFWTRHCWGYGGRGVKAAVRWGFNSIRFNPGDGYEWIIWDPSQVESVRIYSYM